MATVIPIQSTWGLITIGLGYLIFGAMLTALFFFLDFTDSDKDVHYSSDHAQYWLGFVTIFLGINVLFGGGQISNKSMVIRICLSVYCFITSIVSIILEAPDWMRYLSDNRSPDNTCKLAMIAVPGLQREMQYSDYTCKRRTSYAWSVGFTMVSAVLLINVSTCSILLHIWLAIKDQMAYKMPDYPQYIVQENKKAAKKQEWKQGRACKHGF